MIIKDRHPSVSQQILHSLNVRMTLSSLEETQLDALEKGYEGEMTFDGNVKEANLPGVMLCDLTLSARETTYQIDALYVTDKEVIIYEIKNYSGHYIYKDGLIYSDNGYVLQDPLAQVRRKQAYLHNLLLKINPSMKVSSYVVFINFDFYIYLLPKTSQIVFAGQLKNHLTKLAKANTSTTTKARQIADKLTSLNLKNYRPVHSPTYAYEQLKKGIYCAGCHSWNCSISRQYLICSDCQKVERLASAIKRTLDEFRLLFPNEKLSLKTARTWCGPEWTDTRIRRVLRNNYTLHHSGRSSYYT